MQTARWLFCRRGMEWHHGAGWATCVWGVLLEDLLQKLPRNLNHRIYEYRKHVDRSRNLTSGDSASRKPAASGPSCPGPALVRSGGGSRSWKTKFGERGG